MEVDRVSRMNGVGRDGVPAWPRAATRRRKFVEEIPEPESESDEHEPDGALAEVQASPEDEDDRGSALSVMA